MGCAVVGGVVLAVILAWFFGFLGSLHGSFETAL
jgi:hypothetical protein